MALVRNCQRLLLAKTTPTPEWESKEGVQILQPCQHQQRDKENMEYQTTR